MRSASLAAICAAASVLGWPRTACAKAPQCGDSAQADDGPEGEECLLLQASSVLTEARGAIAGGAHISLKSAAPPSAEGVVSVPLDSDPTRPPVEAAVAGTRRKWLWPGDWHKDVFAHPTHNGMGEEVWSAPASDWATLAGVVLVLMLLDFLVFSRMTSYSEASTIRDEQDEKAAGNADDAGPPQQLPEPEPESQERPRSQSHWANLFVLLCWIVCGLAFNALIFFTKGERKGVTWLCGYLLEWMLSFDNIFVFHLVFRTYKTPRELMHKALFFGILGAVIFRVVFFATLLSVMHVLHWVRFAFGVLLVYSGFQAAVEGDDDADPAESTAMRCFQGCLGSRVLGRYDVEGRRLFVTEDGKLLATMLVPVIFCLEVTDILFAVDSVSAKVAQIPDVYIAYSSSVLAMFGLRAMFFVIQDMVEAFDLLKYGLCFILVFIGIELLLADHVELPVHVVCVVICSVLLVCVAASALQRLWSHRRHHAEHSSAASNCSN